MADSKPFLQGIFDPLTTAEEESGLLPGQQPVKPAPKQAKPVAQPVDVQPVQAAPVRAAPTKADVVNRALDLGVDPELALSFFRTESGGNFRSKDSPKGAVGGFQVMPGTYKQMMGTSDGQRDPWNNMEAGLRYIAHGQKVLGTTDPVLLAAGYHAGYGREELKRGEIPNTNDGIMSTRAYAQKVAGGARKNASGAGQQYVPLTDVEINELTAAGKIPASGGYVPLSDSEVAQLKLPSLAGAPAQPGEQGFFDRAGTAISEGWDNTLQNLNTARFALGSGDSADVAQSMAAKFAHQAAQPKTAGQKDIDEAFQRVTDAKGAWDTTVAGFKALGTALSNPKDLAVEIAGQAPNMVPTLGGGAVGAGAGAAVGAGVGAAGLGVGALPGAAAGGIWGGRAGMLAGTTATELGAEVEQMVAERLKTDNKAPTTENIKDLLDSKEFREKARSQGLAKGLTVGVVDQLFLGLGGKIAGAAGRAATLPTKIGLGAAAVGTDAAGEVIGEAVSQQVARGTVDAGDALREGVMSIGQSVVEPAAGAVMRGARRAAGRSAQATPAAEPAATTPASAPAPATPVQVAPVSTPSTAPGMMTRAVEDAAENHAGQPSRVTVTTPDGQQASGQIAAYQEDADGNFVAQIVGDDGQVVTLDSRTGVQIAPEATPEAGPMSAALAAAAEDGAAAQAEPQNAPQNIPEIIPAEVTPIEPSAAPGVPDATAGSAQPAPVATEVAAPAEATTEATAPEVDPIDAAVEKVAAERPRSMQEQLAGMDLPALQERLAYIADQAKASGGWTKMFVDARNAVQREIRKREKESQNAQVRAGDTSVAGELVDAGDAGRIAPVAKAERNQPAGRARTAQPVDGRAAGSAAPVSAAGPTVPGEGAPAVEQPTLTGFTSELDARQALAKQKLGKTHQVIERAPGQFELAPQAAKVPKAKAVKQQPTRKADKLAAAEAKAAKQEEVITQAVEKAAQRHAARRKDDGGVAGERLPGAKESLQATLRDYPDIQRGDGSYKEPAWTELPNGFAYRQYVVGGEPIQEIRAPKKGNIEPPVLRRGLQRDGKPFGEREATGTLDDVLSGAAFADFDEYFKAKPQLENNATAAPTQGEKNEEVQAVPTGQEASASTSEEASQGADVLTVGAAPAKKQEPRRKKTKAEPVVMDEETYLATNGAGRQQIGEAALHRSSERKSEKTHRKQVEAQARKDRDLIVQRARLREEYQAKVAAGEIRPPSAKEEVIAKANGHPDLDSTQAARRIAERRGWEWRREDAEPAMSVAGDDIASAIDRLMADKSGEATVNVPGLGEVKIPYGDSKAGLAHIARRRGDDFIKRLPDLLANGKVYEKGNQKGRVFIGNDRDEAVVSLTRDGKNNTWLLSAYERYPDLKESRRSEVTEDRMPEGKFFTKDDLRKSLTSNGVLGQVIASMIDAGIIVVHGGPNKLPGKARNVKGVQAVTMPDGTIHMVASNLTPRTAMPVLLHEMFHQGGEKLIGTKEWGNLMGRLGSLYRQSEQSSGKARDFYDRARARVESARKKGAVGRAMEVEEFAAYAIEEYEKDPSSLPAAIRKWVEDLIGLIKTWMVKNYGKQIGAVTPAQLAAMARWALMDVAVERRGQMFGPLGEVFSVSDAKGSVPDFISGMEEKYPGVRFDLLERRNGDLHLARIVVPMEGREQGTGTQFMEDLTAFADENGRRIVLTASSDFGGSAPRLTKFYKRFGFVENKGRNKDFSTMEGMYRDPQGGERYSASAEQPTINIGGKERPITNSEGDLIATDAAGQKNFYKWFKDSEVVDRDGHPKVMYHGTSGKIDAFRGNKYRGGTTSFTNDPNIARDYADGAVFVQQERARKAGSTTDAKITIEKVYLSAQKLFDGVHETHRKVVADELQRAGVPAPNYYGTWDAALKSMDDSVLETDEVVSAMKAAGFDGQWVNDAGNGYPALNVFSPSQVKSVENVGEFSEDNADIRYSVADDTETTTAAGAPKQKDGLTPPEQGRLHRLQAAVQDNMNRVKQVQERIMKLTGRTTLGKADYYGAETNRPGRIAARLEDFREGMFQPLIEKLAKAGYKPEQLQELLHAQHAKERNEAVARINPEHDPASGDYTGTQGSGMNDDKAEAILQNYADQPKLLALAQEARDIARATLDLKLAYGLIKPEDHELLTTMYENYIPLKGDGEYGPKIKRATGHGEREEHILENIARDYEQATVAGEKNLARQSLLQMVLKFADDELWTARVPPRGKYVAGKSYSVERNGKSEATFQSLSQVNAFLEAKGAEAANYQVLDNAGERVVEFTKPLQDNEVIVYVNGDPVRLQIHDEALARQLRPLGPAQMNPILEKMRDLNRYLSKIYTGYNPAFIFKNAARDAMTGTINMAGNQGAAVAAKAWGKYPGASKAMFQWAKNKKVPDGKMGAYLNEYRMHGGKTGASYMSDLEQQGKNLQAMFDDARGLAATAKDAGAKRTAALAFRKSVGKLAHVIEIANQTTENALRLALYAALREEGQSPAKAAQAAKTVTVDFDRKGELTGALGAIYLFFNPAVQGTANAMKTLFKGEHRKQAWAALGGLSMLGALAASQGMDEDKDRWLGESWENRTKSFKMNFGGHQFNLPLSQEFAPAYALGVAISEALHGEKPMRSAAHVLTSFLDAYFPLDVAPKNGGDNPLADAAQGVTPTVFKPIAEAAMNRNSFGSQVVPETELTKDRPDNLKMYRGTKGTAYDTAAQAIARGGEALGAGRYENDLTKVSPETLKSLWRTYTGGLGSFVTDSIGAGHTLATGDAGSSDIPIIKDFWREQDVKPLRGRYYDLAREAKQAITEFKQAKKAKDYDEMDRIESDPSKSSLVRLGRMIEATSKQAAELGDEKADVNQSDLPLAEKRAKLKEIEKREEALYREGIDAFKQ